MINIFQIRRKNIPKRREENVMKDVLKGVVTKILTVVVIIVFWGMGVNFGYNKIKPKITHEETSNVKIIKEKLKAAAELNTGNYLCTAVITKADSKRFKKWKIPFTEKSFTVQYDATVKAGIKDLTKADVRQKGKDIIVKLPKVEITGVSIDNDSFKRLDEANNIFNPINIEDLNNAQTELKEEIIEQSKKKGVLKVAKNNAETLITGMLSSTNGDYKIKIEWK